jgi:hypothetical protein
VQPQSLARIASTTSASICHSLGRACGILTCELRRATGDVRDATFNELWQWLLCIRPAHLDSLHCTCTKHAASQAEHFPADRRSPTSTKGHDINERATVETTNPIAKVDDFDRRGDRRLCSMNCSIGAKNVDQI